MADEKVTTPTPTPTPDAKPVVTPPKEASTPAAKAPPKTPEGKEGQSTTSKVDAPKTDDATKTDKVDETTKVEGEETKTDDQADGEKKVPEKYDLKPPENVFSERSLKKFEESARKLGLTNEEAQARLEQTALDVADEITAQSEEWRKQSESDPEVGGAKLAENAEHAKRALKAYFPEDIVTHLDRTGLGNHPSVLKGLARIGRLLAEDKLVVAGKPPVAPKSTAEKLYGSPPSKEG